MWKRCVSVIVVKSRSHEPVALDVLPVVLPPVVVALVEALPLVELREEALVLLAPTADVVEEPLTAVVVAVPVDVDAVDAVDEVLSVVTVLPVVAVGATGSTRTYDGVYVSILPEAATCGVAPATACGM
jgi:hypothetical protein